MPVHGEIRKEYEPWQTYHGKEDILTPTHSLITIDGPSKLYDVAIELPFDEKSVIFFKYMLKEVNTATRFSLTDGIIQVEIEVWDEDEAEKLYFCGDMTLDQAINLSKSKFFLMGFVPVGHPNSTVGAVQLFKKEDLIEIIRIKQRIDALSNPPNKWKVG